MFTACGAQGSWRRALRATRFGLAPLLGVLTVGLATSPATTTTDQLVLAGYGSSGPDSTAGSMSTADAEQAQSTGTFKIAGSVGGLYPGQSKPLVLTVKNPQGFKIVVTSMTTKVKNASATCPASNLTVSAFSGQLAVPANGSAKTSVVVTMAKSAPDACKAVTFPLVYSGLAKRP
jgi:hypothetical protein